MKIAIVSDIHGNLSALDAVLRHAKSHGATQTIINLGDLVGYGPDPEAIVRWSQSVHVINLLGDYDKKILSKKSRKTGWAQVKNPDKRAMFSWTYHALSKHAREILRSYPETQSISLGGYQVLCTHTGPAGSTKQYLEQETPEQVFVELVEKNGADIILCGHSHHAFIRRVNDVLFLNPGSLGRLDDGDPRASYAILEFDQDHIDAQIFRVPYDLVPVLKKIRQTGLPEVFAQVIQQGLNYADVIAKFGDHMPALTLEPNGTLTLLTDFGMADHFAGVMKGVILEIASQTTIVDISHQVKPQNVIQGARLLAEAVPFFAPGTVHVAVIDPGVGTNRRAIAARVGTQYFVAPDNGLLTFILKDAQTLGQPVEIYHLDQPQYWLPNPSHSFHGRDIFSPVGAHLVNGIPIQKLGTLINDPVRLSPPQPQHTTEGWLAEVVMVDIFGNLSTNFRAELIPVDLDQTTVEILREKIQGLTPTFGDAPQGMLIATIDSSGWLAISIVNGNAKDHLSADIGTPIKISFGETLNNPQEV